MDEIAVLSTCPAAQTVAEAMGCPLASEVSLGGRYVIVADNSAAVSAVEAMAGDSPGTEAGTEDLVAVVAWRLPATLIARLARTSVPVLVGLPSQWDLSVAMEGNNAERLAEEVTAWANAESYLRRPTVPVFTSAPLALEARS